MGTEGTRARSHAHARRQGRITVHLVVILLAAVAVTLAARYPNSSGATNLAALPAFPLSGVAGNTQHRSDTYLSPEGSHQTRASVVALTTRSDVASVRAAGAVSPTTTFSASVSAAAAGSGIQGAGVRALADIVDPRRPFEIIEARAGDSASAIAARYGIQLGTLLDNNHELGDGHLLAQGQALIVPFKDGILYKIGYGDTLGSIVNQYDNITVDEVVAYRPNAVAKGEALEPGKYLLLVGATRKPPPPPPPPPPASSGGTPGTPPPNSGGRFSLPLSAWRAVSDPFGTGRGGGRIHEGLDLDLYGYHHSRVYSACTGVVTRTEYLTYSYGYYVSVDCGDGWSTLYAHFDEILVSPGQRVSQGAQIGVSGTTGFTTGEHLHFEIRFEGGPLNPALYLPF